MIRDGHRLTVHFKSPLTHDECLLQVALTRRVTTSVTRASALRIGEASIASARLQAALSAPHRCAHLTTDSRGLAADVGGTGRPEPARTVTTSPNIQLLSS